ncbi:hypothetical protein TIFTF001_015277 [Ficus carica]|uniref:Ubiquitin-like protease family profile domain-containing protein n=1 Tax=Ficus carica TaxID=3494 RepID=A0AA88D8T4_FICCA|nr:hypothetical protein TIFTF001_015277 [Ficus carica]
MRVKPDGEFKNASFKIIADTIDDFSEQETQGSFESVGTDDILIKALGNAKHSGRIRGQSKFVKQSQYFNLVQSLRENAEISDMKRAYMDCVLTDTVHGIPLGEENVQVTITVPKLQRALLTIPTNEVTCIEEAVGGIVAWPKSVVVVQTSLSQASQGPSHAPHREAEGSKRTKKIAGKKKIQSQPEVQQQSVQQELHSFDFSQIPFELRPLAYYEQSSIGDGTQIACPLQQFVIGDDMPIYIGFEDVYHFITFKEISVNSIMVYIRYLADCCARVDREAYVRERADNILRILRNAPKGKLFLMPYNSGQHWILAVIDLWDDSVLYFNPLGNEPGDDFKYLITMALNNWKLLMGRGIRERRNYETLIDTVRCPIQKGYVECSYFVLAFMREITLTVDELALLQTKEFYTDPDMSLVRQK